MLEQPETVSLSTILDRLLKQVRASMFERERQKSEAPPSDDVINQAIKEECERTRDQIIGDLIESVGRCDIKTILETHRGTEPMPNDFWLKNDGSPTPHARRAMLLGKASSNRYPGVAGTIMVYPSDFQAFVERCAHYRFARAAGLMSEPTPEAVPPPAYDGSKGVDGIQAAAPKQRQIPPSLIDQYFDREKGSRRVPSQAKAVQEIKEQHPNYNVTRRPVIKAHQAAFPDLRPGKR